MAWPLKLLLAVFLILATAIGPTHGDAMVTGTVLCDQCKDGHVSLFDYPVLGIKVSMACPGSDGQMVTLKEETTNWLGNYDMRIEGTPELRGCYAQISGSGQGSMGCGAAAGPVQKLRLMFSMFDMEFYTVDPLLSQPAKPMPFCPSSPGNTVPAPVTPATPPPVRVPPVPVTPPPVRVPPVPATGPPFRFPPAPRLPPLPPLPPMPPMPFLEASACPHQMWTMPQYHCYWRLLRPDTKVAIVFGPMAARRYGTDITLIGSMGGRGDPYKTLLREGTTALLNSYNSLQFPYNPLGVVQHMNWALMGGSTRQVLHTALHFMKANSGNGNMACRFNSCK